MDASGLTSNGEVNVYKYDMKISSKYHSEDDWTVIGSVDSSVEQPIPSLRQFLSAIKVRLFALFIKILDLLSVIGE